VNEIMNASGHDSLNSEIEEKFSSFNTQFQEYSSIHQLVEKNVSHLLKWQELKKWQRANIDIEVKKINN